MNNKHIDKCECLQRRLLFVSIACGVLISLFGIRSNAQEQLNAATSQTPTITIDVKNKGSEIDYKQLDKFISSEDPNKKIKFASKDGNDIIFSDKPIMNAYMAKRLADLGMKMHQHRVVKGERVQMASKNISALPSVPAFTPTPVNITVATAATAHFAPAGIVYHQQQTKASNAASPAISISNNVLDGMIAASGFIVCLLTLALVRKNARKKQALYAGELGAPNELVGSGDVFDFNDLPAANKRMPINSTYLNMMWHLGRFSKDSNVNTYFYMAFYIPPHQKYAAALKKKTVVKRTETNA